MAVFATIAFATFFLENDHFVTFYEGFFILAYHFRAFHGRRTDLNVAVGVQKKDFVEAYGIAFLHVVAEMVDIQELALFGLELLSFDFYDCVHFLYLMF